MKKVLSILLAVAMTITPLTFAVSAESESEIVIIYTNDTHCEVDADLGFADICAIEAIEKAKGNEVIVIDAGDAVQGGAIGAISKGSYIIDIMNEVGYDMAVLGNHEFDYKLSGLTALTDMASFPYISANFVNTEDGSSVYEPYYMVNIGDTDIAFIGITTPHTFTSSAPDYFKNDEGEFVYDFSSENFYTLIQSTVDEVKDNGADIVIAVAHLGVDPADAPYTSKELIASTSGFDAVIDAHSHTVIDGEICENEQGESVLLTSTGSKFQNIGIMRLSGDGISSELVTADYKADGVPADGQDAYAEIDSFIDAIKAEYSAELERKIAVSEVCLTVNNPDKYNEETGAYREVRRGETNLGDFCADAYKAALGCDIAFINGGGVRADIAEGDISYGDLLNVNPFGNELCVIKVSGSQIADALEHGARSYPLEEGAFLQVSGLSYEIVENIPSSVVLDETGMFSEVSGERRVKNIRVDGKPIDENATYTLGGSVYSLLDGGDGFSMFKDAEVVNRSACTDLDALIKYASEDLGGVVGEAYENPHGDGRIKVVTKRPVFEDIDGHWAKSSIMLAVQNNLVSGISDTVFAPDMNITRAMFVTILYRAEDMPSAPELNFTDVESGMYYADAAAWANANGIVFGISETEFAPDDNITREQMAAILYRYSTYKGYNTSVGEDTNILSYTDAFDINDYAITAMQWATGSGIISGKDGGILDPLGNATRAEATAMLARLLITL